MLLVVVGITSPSCLNVVGYLIDLSKSLKSDFNEDFICFFSAALNSTWLPLPFLPLILCL